jgi:5-methyltetrahydropteroyltriglutamate--homocysteine methyltransferase
MRIAEEEVSTMLKTTVVGSYPVPDWLKTLPNRPTLLDAIAVVMRAQEGAGVDVICDGELGRWDLERNEPGGMVERFVRLMSGAEIEATFEQRQAYRQAAGTSYRAHVPAVITRPLGSGRMDLVGEWRQSSGLSALPQKFTITSPYMIGKLVLDEHYRDLEKRTLAVADVLADQVSGIDAAVLQIDEPNLPGTPDDGPLAAAAMNRILSKAGSKEKAVHLCFGNYGGQTIQAGDYRKLIDFLNALDCDHLVLETTRRPREELEALREIRPEIRLGIGVIDVKDLQVESPEVVARRIEAIASIVGEERLAYVHPDCGLQNLPRAAADGNLRALVAGRDLFAG